MGSVLITGANRGLGLAWVARMAAENWRVFAACRHPAEAVELQRLARKHEGLSIHRCDVTVPDEVRGLYWELEGEPLDLLIDNAGVYLEKGATVLGSLRYDDWLRTFEVNVLGQVRIAEAFAGNLAHSDHGLLVSVSSHMGSIEDITAPGSYYYRSSKAALNAAMSGIAAELEQQGIGVLIVHPGAVATRMGPSSGISPAESVEGMRRLIERFGPEMHGRFFRYDGEELPW